MADMYILSGDRKQIVNIEFVERICLAEKPDAALIVASYGCDRPPVTLARCSTFKESSDVLSDMLYAISGGQAYYTMPDSLMYGEAAQKKDARTKRKGGS